LKKSPLKREFWDTWESRPALIVVVRSPSAVPVAVSPQIVRFLRADSADSSPQSDPRAAFPPSSLDHNRINPLTRGVGRVAFILSRSRITTSDQKRHIAAAAAAQLNNGIQRRQHLP